MSNQVANVDNDRYTGSDIATIPFDYTFAVYSNGTQPIALSFEEDNQNIRDRTNSAPPQPIPLYEACQYRPGWWKDELSVSSDQRDNNCRGAVSGAKICYRRC